jgi:hypothetical protein
VVFPVPPLSESTAIVSAMAAGDDSYSLSAAGVAAGAVGTGEVSRK